MSCAPSISLHGHREPWGTSNNCLMESGQSHDTPQVLTRSSQLTRRGTVSAKESNVPGGTSAHQRASPHNKHPTNTTPVTQPLGGFFESAQRVEGGTGIPDGLCRARFWPAPGTECAPFAVARVVIERRTAPGTQGTDKVIRDVAMGTIVGQDFRNKNGVGTA